MRNTALLRTVGEALYGLRWQCAIARELGVNDRTVRRWVAGTETPRAQVWVDLIAIGETRQKQLGEALAALSKFIAVPGL